MTNMRYAQINPGNWPTNRVNFKQPTLFTIASFELLDFAILACSRYFSWDALVVSKAMSSIPGFSHNYAQFSRITIFCVLGNYAYSVHILFTLGDSFLGGVPVGIQCFTLQMILRNVVVKKVWLFQIISNFRPPPCLPLATGQQQWVELATWLFTGKAQQAGWNWDNRNFLEQWLH